MHFDTPAKGCSKTDRRRSRRQPEVACVPSCRPRTGARRGRMALVRRRRAPPTDALWPPPGCRACRSCALLLAQIYRLSRQPQLVPDVVHTNSPRDFLWGSDTSELRPLLSVSPLPPSALPLSKLILLSLFWAIPGESPSSLSQGHSFYRPARRAPESDVRQLLPRRDCQSRTVTAVARCSTHLVETR